MATMDIPKKCRFRVVTDCGIVETMAVSEAKARRNAQYRVVMEGSVTRRPSIRELMAMREVEILSVDLVQEVVGR